MKGQYKRSRLDECSRDYLENLVADLEEQASRYQPINHRFLAEARAAIATAPDSFIVHRTDR